MNKSNDAPGYDYPNNQSPLNQPFGYPDLSGMLPESYPKTNGPAQKYVYGSSKLSNSKSSNRR